MSELPTAIGQLDALSGHLVAVDCDGIARWNTAAHGGVARQVAGTPTGGPLVFDGVSAVAWPGRGPVHVRGLAADAGWKQLDVLAATAPSAPHAGPAIGQLALTGSRLFLGDLAALGRWAPGQSTSGKADLSFSGRDAAHIAGIGQIPELGGGHFGWVDLAEPQAHQWKTWVEQQAARGGSVDIVLTPHDHRHAAEALLRQSPVGAGVVQVGGGACVVVDVRRPAGQFPVLALLDAGGQVCGVRIVFETSPQALPPDPMTATKNALKSAATDQAQSMATKAAWRKLKGMLPRWAWPLLPDGKRDFVTRARDLGEKKLMAMVGGCLFTGCFALVVLGILSSVGFYVLYVVLQSL